MSNIAKSFLLSSMVAIAPVGVIAADSSDPRGHAVRGGVHLNPKKRPMSSSLRPWCSRPKLSLSTTTSQRDR